jgi:hypothetical protein
MSVSHTGQGLYPIVRRVRRPLLPVEEEKPPQPGVGAVPAASKKSQPEKRKGQRADEHGK